MRIILLSIRYFEIILYYYIYIIYKLQLHYFIIQFIYMYTYYLLFLYIYRNLKYIALILFIQSKLQGFKSRFFSLCIY